MGDDGEQTIGLSLSGGGYRAAGFGLGVLCCLRRCGLHTCVETVASVSGGSLLAARALTSSYTVGPKDDLGGFTDFFHGLAVAPVWTPSNLARFAVRRPTLHDVVWTNLLGDGDPDLADLASPDYVFCTTNLHDGDFVYLGNRLIWSRRLGFKPPDLDDGLEPPMTLRAAVRASSAVPGVFPPERLLTRGFSRYAGGDVPPAMLCADGGIHDTLATQWFDDLDDARADISPWRPDPPEQPRMLLVVDGSLSVPKKRWLPWSRIPMTDTLLPVLSTISAWKRSASLAIDNWDRRNLQRLRELRLAQAEVGVMGLPAETLTVSVRENPLRTAQDESRPAILRLGIDWPRMVAGNVRAGTIPHPLGNGRVIDLVHHGYIAAWSALVDAGDVAPDESPLPTRGEVAAWWSA